MKRVLAAGLVCAATSLFVVLPSGSASAAPLLCLDLNIDVNGQGQTQQICLPPEGGSLPQLPGLG